MIVRCLLFFALFSQWLGLSTVTAQTTYAVIVGVSDYKFMSPGNGDLRYADDDARLFASLLQHPTGGNVPASNIILLTEQQATRSNILRAMTLFQRATSADRIIFFFAGHGDEGILVPYDGSRETLLLHNDVKYAFRQSAARTKLLLADACKSGSMRRHTAPPRITPVSADKNIIVMMSSRSNQFSEENPRLQHGAFTYFLVKGAGGSADLDRNRVVTMQELYAYMRAAIQGMTNNRQTPVVFGHFSASMPFTYLRG